MRIEVVYATTSQSWSADVDCEKGCTVAQALRIAATLDVFESAPIDRADGYSVWGKVVDSNYELAEGDRLEVLRGLDHDPMQLRRMNADR
ncbi:MAG: RnfH family protein [Gammaproteobacteria bacterium]|nr:RnfH family protein [Gammaproteobacteria bacterium]